MRSSSWPAFRPRRLLAVTGLLSLALGLLMLTAAAHPAHAAASVAAPTAAGNLQAAAGHSPAPRKPSRAATKQFEAQVKQLAKAGRSAAASHGSFTKMGPHMWDPSLNGGQGGPNPNPSSVTVSQTASLVNQQLTVSWTNFTPSSNLAYNPANVAYPVMVAECKGTNPASPADCYAAENGGVTSTSGPFGPDNTSYATTAPDGTGVTDVQILTGVENQFLLCSQSSPCSLAIVPSQGGNYTVTPPNCADHSQDFFFGTGFAVGSEAFGGTNFSCSWAQRIMVPLTFARTASTCPTKTISNPVFSVAGSPMLSRAMNSWIAALCQGSHGFGIAYDGTLGEPAALQEVGSQLADVALTTRPASIQAINTGTNKFVYAPVGVTAVSIAYWFDNPVTGLPQTGVELDQTLVLKLLTQSYAFENDSCPIIPPPPLGCDNGVDHDPINLFTDPEFTALNPTVVEPVNGTIEIPTVVSGNSDMTWVVTNWITASTAGKGFLAGQFDANGYHINTYYLGLTWPYNSFVPQDPYPIIQHEYNPVFPLYTVASDQVLNWPPGTSVTKDQTGNYPRLPNQVPGQRALIAVLDQGDSAAFLFPTFAIPNGAGKYVQPTTASMLAALKGMTNDGNGTQLVNPNSKKKSAYPLTMVVYAMVPTSGISHTKAVAIAKWLDFAAGAGQTPGVQPGQLPLGFAPLPASMRAQTRKDALKVLHQTGATKTKTTNPSLPPASPTPSPTSSPGSVSLPAVTPSPTAGGPGISLVNDANAGPASITRYIFPALLILGGLAALAGSSSLIGASSDSISARLRRIRQGSVALRSRLRPRRSK
jgi:hypothetical protein